MVAILGYGRTATPRRDLASTRVDRDQQLVEPLRCGEPAAADRLLTT